MYFYLYDSFLSHKKYATVLTKIENRLIDLGINGKIEKMSILKSLKEVIENNIKSGIDTVIAVGNDKTFAKVVPLVAGKNGVTLGFIPIGESLIARVLGLPRGEKACDVLSARLIEKIDLGKVNNHYFFSTLEISQAKPLVLEDNNGHFRITSLNQGNHFKICNLSILAWEKQPNLKGLSDPRDGLLEAIFTPAQKNIFGQTKLDFNKISVFPIKKIKIKSSEDSIPIIADGETIVKTPVTVQVMPRKLKLIVSKGRQF